MIHAHFFEYMKTAHYHAYRFIDEHHFMSRAVYDRWCRGRTYMIGDTLYRSDFPFENDWKN